jgi:hypothetical protein
MNKQCTVLNANGAIANVAGGSVLFTGKGIITGVNFVPGATGNSLIIYDCTLDADVSAATILYKSIATVTTSGCITNIYAFLPNIEVKKGIYVVQTGSSSASQIYY